MIKNYGYYKLFGVSAFVHSCSVMLRSWIHLNPIKTWNVRISCSSPCTVNSPVENLTKVCEMAVGVSLHLLVIVFWKDG